MHFKLHLPFRRFRDIDRAVVKADDFNEDSVHDIVPSNDEELHQCWTSVRAQMQKDTSWSPERLSLYFRTLCVPPTLFLRGQASMARDFDLSTMQVMDPKREPELNQTMAFATRAGTASLLLYRRTPGTIEPKELALQEQAQAHYMASVVDLANRGKHDTSANDLQYLALAATFRRDAGAPRRDWSSLLFQELRWCLAAPAQTRHLLMQSHPETVPHLREFTMLCELVSPFEALHQIWYPSPRNDVTLYALPDGATL